MSFNGEVNRIGDISMGAYLSLAFWFCHQYYFFYFSSYILVFALCVILRELAESITKRKLFKALEDSCVLQEHANGLWECSV